MGRLLLPSLHWQGAGSQDLSQSSNMDFWCCQQRGPHFSLLIHPSLLFQNSSHHPFFASSIVGGEFRGGFSPQPVPPSTPEKQAQKPPWRLAHPQLLPPAGHIIILQLSSHSAANLYLLLSLSALLLIFLSAAFSCHPSLPSCLIFASCSFSVSPFLPKSLTMTGTAGNRDLWGLGREALGDCVGWRTEAPLRSLPSLASSWYVSPSLTICISSWALP